MDAESFRWALYPCDVVKEGFWAIDEGSGSCRFAEIRFKKDRPGKVLASR